MFQELITSQEIESMPLCAFEGQTVVISSPGRAFEEAIRYLRRQSVIGFDTETKPVFNHGEKHHPTALLQLSGPNKAYLFRLTTLGMPYRLRSILSDKRIVKVGAAVTDDVRGLQRIQNFRPAGFVDLQTMVEEYGIKSKSVKKMAAIILGVRISKSQQCSNWEADPYTEAQVSYAATDAWICLKMYKRLLQCPKAAEEKKAGESAAEQKSPEEA